MTLSSTTKQGFTTYQLKILAVVTMTLDHIYSYLGGSLPIPVHLLMDEFANGVTRSTPKTVGITDKSVA